MKLTKHYDLTYLKELASGDEKFVQEMVVYFCTHSPGLLEAMDECLVQEDWKEMRELIHKYIPNINMVGIKNVLEDANRLEYYAEHREKLDLIPEILRHINTEVAIGIEELRHDFHLLK